MIVFNNNGMGLGTKADVINLRKPYPLFFIAWLCSEKLRVVNFLLLSVYKTGLNHVYADISFAKKLKEMVTMLLKVYFIYGNSIIVFI